METAQCSRDIKTLDKEEMRTVLFNYLNWYLYLSSFVFIL